MAKGGSPARKKNSTLMAGASTLKPPMASLLRSLAALGVGLTVIVSAASCGIGSESFAQDQSVSIEAPRPLATVSTPLLIRWSAQRPLPKGEWYAVFVDRPTVSPGHSLREVTSAACQRNPACPTIADLNSLNVFITNATFIVVPSVPIFSAHGNRFETHQAIIFYVDSHRRRVSEAAFEVTFRIGARA